MRQGEQQAECDHQPGAATVVVELEANRMRRQAPRGAERVRVGVRIPVGEQQQVRVGLRRVADAVGAQVAQPVRHPPEGDRREPAEETANNCDTRKAAGPGLAGSVARVRAAAAAGGPAQHPGKDERGHGKEETEPDRPPALRCRRRDLHVDGVPGRPRESWIGIRRHRDVRAEMRHVADVHREEVMQPVRQPPLHQRHEPGDDCEHDDAERPQHDPEEVRDREEQPEEDGQPRSLKIVVDDEPDRMFVHGLESTMLRCR